jgi:hypothetical protein
LAEPRRGQVVEDNEEIWNKGVFSFAKVAKEMGSFPTLGEGDGITTTATWTKEMTVGGGAWGMGGGSCSATKTEAEIKATAPLQVNPKKGGKKKKLKYKPLVL